MRKWPFRGPVLSLTKVILILTNVIINISFSKNNHRKTLTTNRSHLSRYLSFFNDCLFFECSTVNIFAHLWPLKLFYNFLTNYRAENDSCVRICRKIGAGVQKLSSRKVSKIGTDVHCLEVNYFMDFLVWWIEMSSSLQKHTIYVWEWGGILKTAELGKDK